MMLNRLAVLVVLLLAVGVVPASAQFSIVDSNNTMVGRVLGVGVGPFGDAEVTLVATQDNNGLWLVVSIVRDRFSPLLDLVGGSLLVVYTDAACATTPYLAASYNSTQPLFQPVQASGLPGTPGYYYAGFPLTTQTFHSRSQVGRPDLCTTEQNGPWTAGPLTVFDPTQFVPPFAVQ
jgi:hypothetical protein